MKIEVSHTMYYVVDIDDSSIPADLSGDERAKEVYALWSNEPLVDGGASPERPRLSGYFLGGEYVGV